MRVNCFCEKCDVLQLFWLVVVQLGSSQCFKLAFQMTSETGPFNFSFNLVFNKVTSSKEQQLFQKVSKITSTTTIYPTQNRNNIFSWPRITLGLKLDRERRKGITHHVISQFITIAIPTSTSNLNSSVSYRKQSHQLVTLEGLNHYVCGLFSHRNWFCSY